MADVEKALAVVKEVLTRCKYPFLEATYRNANGKTYGPYFVARWRPYSKSEQGRTIYLGKLEKEETQKMMEVSEITNCCREWSSRRTERVRRTAAKWLAILVTDVRDPSALWDTLYDAAALAVKEGEPERHGYRVDFIEALEYVEEELEQKKEEGDESVEEHKEEREEVMEKKDVLEEIKKWKDSEDQDSEDEEDEESEEEQQTEDEGSEEGTSEDQEEQEEEHEEDSGEQEFDVDKEIEKVVNELKERLGEEIARNARETCRTVGRLVRRVVLEGDALWPNDWDLLGDLAAVCKEAADRIATILERADSGNRESAKFDIKVSDPSEMSDDELLVYLVWLNALRED